jgi:amidase
LTNDLTNHSAAELVRLIRSRAVSPVEVLQAHLRRIEQVNPTLNAIVTLAEDAIDNARAAETALMKGEGGTLHGLPVTIKDTIDVKGLRTTGGSRLLAEHVAHRDATAVARLKNAGAIVIGKTNVAEMAAYYESDNPVFGRTNNPFDLNYTVGGSSGGEAAAIAAGLSPAGLGSDLAGSVRLPAHFCGISALKPTMGAVPADGHTPAVAGPLMLGDAFGPMARTVDDLALLFEAIADEQPAGTTKTVEGIAHHRRAAWYVHDGVSPVDEETAAAVERAVATLKDAGWQVEHANPPGISKGFGLWMDLFSKFVSHQLAETYRGREHEAGPQVAAMLARLRKKDQGRDARIDAAERLARAIVEREKTREELLRWMKATPIMIAPVGATCAWRHGTQRLEISGESISVFRAFSYSQTINVFGLPAVAVPAGRTAQGLPIGVQVIGRPFEEFAVLSAARIIEHGLGGWSLPVV